MRSLIAVNTTAIDNPAVTKFFNFYKYPKSLGGFLSRLIDFCNSAIDLSRTPTLKLQASPTSSLAQLNTAGLIYPASFPSPVLL
ncbi:MAG: hypothetical protein KY448_00840 [Cyanobacteria bacterium 0813]|nr:hypothetical protein [Cyanobacteria bacterium 0813]